jgi:hypothetical protein
VCEGFLPFGVLGPGVLLCGRKLWEIRCSGVDDEGRFAGFVVSDVSYHRRRGKTPQVDNRCGNRKNRNILSISNFISKN